MMKKMPQYLHCHVELLLSTTLAIFNVQLIPLQSVSQRATQNNLGIDRKPRHGRLPSQLDLTNIKGRFLTKIKNKIKQLATFYIIKL